MIGKGREQRGESKKSRERERRKRKGETFVYRELYYCIIFIMIVTIIIIMPLPYYFHSIHIDCLPFSPISLLSSPLLSQASFHSFIIFMSEV